MKRLIFFSAIVSLVTASAFLVQQSVSASDVPMTEAHIERIRTNCVEAQAILRRLHASDALLRVNRGQLYELMATKLMAPFNSRASLNRLDATKLVSVAGDYERQLDTFRENYKSYEEAMSAAISIDCVDRPVAFYDLVTDARAKRQKVHDSTKQLNSSIAKYQSEFDAFAKTIDNGEAK